MLMKQLSGHDSLLAAGLLRREDTPDKRRATRPAETTECLLHSLFVAGRGGCRASFRNCAGDEPTTRLNAVLNALSDR